MATKVNNEEFENKTIIFVPLSLWFMAGGTNHTMNQLRFICFAFLIIFLIFFLLQMFTKV